VDEVNATFVRERKQQKKKKSQIARTDRYAARPYFCGEKIA
jgi:hypothetical protein